MDCPLNFTAIQQQREMQKPQDEANEKYHGVIF